MQLHRKKNAVSEKARGRLNSRNDGNNEGSSGKKLPDFGEASSSFVRVQRRANDDIERNITSSDVEFLEGRDVDEDLEIAATRRIVKGKPESPQAFSNVEHVLTSDLSGLQTDFDVDMNEIMLVLIK